MTECPLCDPDRPPRGFPPLPTASLPPSDSCGRESRQLEDHPRAGIHFRQYEGHGRPFGGHPDLGTGSYVARGLGVLPAVAAENDWRLRRSCTAAAGSTTSSAMTTGNCAGASGSASRGLRGPGTTGTRGAGTTESRGDATGAAKRQASDIALANRSIPGGLDLTGRCIGCDAVEDAVVDEDVGFGTPPTEPSLS